jgi:hypothetical protein
MPLIFYEQRETGSVGIMWPAHNWRAQVAGARHWVEIRFDRQIRWKYTEVFVNPDEPYQDLNFVFEAWRWLKYAGHQGD